MIAATLVLVVIFMTTLILSSIGIILAAAVAFMAFWYGGTALGASYDSADAVRIMNAGRSVKSAYGVFVMRYRRAPADVGDLSSPVGGVRLLKATPDLSSFGTMSKDWVAVPMGSSMSDAFVVEGVSDRICAAVNDQVAGSALSTPIPDHPVASEGCFAKADSSGNIFYEILPAS